jgi:hypothetical protein
MKIKVSIEQEIPAGFYCHKNNGRECQRLEPDSKNSMLFCTLFNRYVTQGNGRYVKCDERLKATCDAIKEGNT